MSLYREQRWGAALIALSLALTIGAATAIFYLTDRLFWAPLPFSGADAIVVVRDFVRRNDLDLVRVLSGSRSFASAALFDVGLAEFHLLQEAGRLRAAEASVGILKVLGVAPILGRGFEDADEHAGSERVVLLSERFWSQRFGRSPNLIGRVMLLQGASYRVVGIVPRAIDLLGGADALIARHRATPARILSGTSVANEIRVDGIIARLRLTATIEQAASELAVLAGPGSERPNADRGRLQRLRDVLAPRETELAAGAMASVVGLFMLGCANVCVLYVAWLQARRRELATKLALGISLRALTLRCTTEAGLVVSVAGLLGLLVAHWSATPIMASLPAASHLLQDWSLDARSVAVALAFVLVTMSLLAAIGVSTLARLWGADLVTVLSASGTGIRLSRRGVRTQRALMTLGFALSVGFLGSASVMTGTFLSQTRVDLGFRAEGLVAFEVWNPPFRLPAYDGAGDPPPEWRARVIAQRAERRRRFYTLLLEKVSMIPGVTRVGATSWLPLTAAGRALQYVDTGSPRDGTMARISVVSGDYFETVGIQLLQGTTLARSDVGASAPVVIDAILAAQLWPDQPATGRTLRIAHGPPRQIVGVVTSVESTDVLSSVRGQVYVPNAEPLEVRGDLAILLRSPRPLPELAPHIRVAIQDADPAAIVYDLRTGDDLVDVVMSPARTRSLLFVLIAVLAAVVSGTGVFAATAQWLMERRTNIALHTILGASGRDITWLTIRESLFIVCAGGVMGVSIAWILTETVRAALVDMGSPWVGILAGLGLAALVALGTTYVVTRRFTRSMSLRIS
jgi:putative ABC transport system permease protein